MNIYIINLPAQIERAAFQEKQFARLGLAFSRVDAVSIEDVPDDYYKKVAFDWERPLSRAEVSCYLSHQSLWQRVISDNEPALILEDDAYLCDDLPQLLSAFEKLKVNYINLETRCRKKIVSKKSERAFFGYQLKQLYYGGTGAAAYIIWPEAAQRLLDKEQRSGMALADAQICRTKLGSAWQLDCAAAIQLDCCDHYQIKSPYQTTSSLAKTRFQQDVIGSKYKSIFKRRRLIAQFKLGIIQLKACFCLAERKEITIKKSKFDLSN